MPTARQPSLGRGARSRILAAARELFVDPGINATGIAELIAHARVSRRTLYQQFASKDELVAAYLRELADDPRSAPQRVLGDVGLTPRARLLEMFAALADGPRPLRGDPFLNAAVEISGPHHPARGAIDSRQAELTEQLRNLSREAGAKKSERLAEQLLIVYEGAAAAVLIADDPTPVVAATAIARALLAAALD